MATHLDLEEQEQLDELKHFWKQYGNLITWVLILALASFAGWNFWLRWQHSRAVQAGAMYDEIDKAAQEGKADRAAALFENLKERYPGTTFAQQAALVVAKIEFDKGQSDKALATLGWVGEHADQSEYKTVARLRMAGILMQEKKYDEALQAARQRRCQGLCGARLGQARRHPPRPGQEGRRARRLSQGMGRDGSFCRLSAPDCGEAGRARRSSGGGQAERPGLGGFPMSRRPGWLAMCIAAGATILVAACSSAPEKPKPVPLAALTPTIGARVVWQQHVDGVKFPLSVAVSPGVFTVASDDGTVLALEADTGRELWRGSAGGKLGAGVGSDGRFASVITRDGELVTFEAGRLLWRKPLNMRVSTAPLVAGERVFVLGGDRSVMAFDAAEGTQLWRVQRPSDPLTLSQGGVIGAYKDTLVAGQGPKLAGFDPRNGDVRWEVTIGSPRGTNEVERLADLVAPAARVGELICVRSFQAAVGCVNAERQTAAWTKPVGGTDGVAADDQHVYGADASDRITAWKLSSGEVAWQSEKLLYHGLSAPLATGKLVVFGDSEGMVHFLSRDNGDALLRMTTDGTPVVAAPVNSGNTVMVVTRGGGLYGFGLQ